MSAKPTLEALLAQLFVRSTRPAKPTLVQAAPWSIPQAAPRSVPQSIQQAPRQDLHHVKVCVKAEPGADQHSSMGLPPHPDNHPATNYDQEMDRSESDRCFAQLHPNNPHPLLTSQSFEADERQNINVQLRKLLAIKNALATNQGVVAQNKVQLACSTLQAVKDRLESAFVTFGASLCDDAMEQMQAAQNGMFVADTMTMLILSTHTIRMDVAKQWVQQNPDMYPQALGPLLSQFMFEWRHELEIGQHRKVPAIVDVTTALPVLTRTQHKCNHALNELSKFLHTQTM